MITYHSIQDILELCEKEQMTFAQVIERADMEERAVTAGSFLCEDAEHV